MNSPATASTRCNPLSDRGFEDLLAAAKRGAADARNELFRRFYPRVEQFVHVALARDLRAKRPWISARFSTGDVVQEVFRSVLSDLADFRGSTPDSFFGFLSTVVRNRLLDLLRYHEAERRDGRRTTKSDEDEVSADDGPATDALAAERRAIFAEILGSFPEREQALLRGRIEQRREFQELSDELQFSSVSAARRAFYLAQAQLVLRLKRRDLGESR
tara:strand:+ start:209 stop:859 length:651 start_codon:yes stop_codon:yes gene_type:complete